MLASAVTINRNVLQRVLNRLFLQRTVLVKELKPNRRVEFHHDNNSLLGRIITKDGKTSRLYAPAGFIPYRISFQIRFLLKCGKADRVYCAYVVPSSHRE